MRLDNKKVGGLGRVLAALVRKLLTEGKLTFPCQPVANNKCKGNLKQKILVWSDGL